MSWKTRSQCFKGHFNEVDVWSPIIVKRVIWYPIIAIFSFKELAKQQLVLTVKAIVEELTESFP
jgi:hypothetical protein